MQGQLIEAGPPCLCGIKSFRRFQTSVFPTSPKESVVELELVLLQPHMTHKPLLRGEVGARALRV